jgi:C-methyltransferase C-terminal domain/Putative zinc binding domain/Methyltransferase domain
MLYKEITNCRLCNGARIVNVLDLGKQALTGIFPKSKEEEVPAGPLQLCKCADCDLVQLRHNYDLGKLYGETYGYRSGLNQSMVRHLHQKVEKIRSLVHLSGDDLVVDIGSNDSTLLQAYPKGLTLVGIDPSGPKFKQYYPQHVRLIPDFFSAGLVERFYPGKRAKVITSIAMFYDLERPQDFVDEVARVLDDEGIWVFEQSYLPFMLDTNSYDTICHEHVEYYSLHQIKWLLDRAEMKIIDIEFNDINGGSFSVVASKKTARHVAADALISRTLEDEQRRGLSSIETYTRFGQRIADHRKKLIFLLRELKLQRKKVIGYGASTKGNVLIQYCGINADLIPCIAEVNPDKFGAYTPGSRIPIVSEAEARAMKPDYFLVFPWHFKAEILNREQAFLQAGGQLILPLPTIDLISSAGRATI